MPAPAPGPSTGSGPIRVFLAEDHAITLWGLQRLIEGQTGQLRVVGTASTADALCTHPALAEADVLLMDLDLAGADAVDLLPELQRRSPARVLVLTAAEDADRLCRALSLGAQGVLHKSEPPQQILAAIAQVHQGAAWLNPRLLGEVLGRLNNPPASAPGPDARRARIASLTARERDIVQALVRNPSAKLVVVAAELGLSDNTLRNHLTTVYSKLGVRGRLELHMLAADSSLGGG